MNLFQRLSAWTTHVVNRTDDTAIQSAVSDLHDELLATIEEAVTAKVNSALGLKAPVTATMPMAASTPVAGNAFAVKS